MINKYTGSVMEEDNDLIPNRRKDDNDEENKISFGRRTSDPIPDRIEYTQKEVKELELEVGGMNFKFKNSMIIVAFTILSSIGGAMWAGFEFYKDYMDMKEIIANIDVEAIQARNAVIETKLTEAIDYTRDIKQGLKDDILGIEKQVDRLEDKVRASEEDVRQSIASAETRFENKRDALQNDYDRKAADLRDRTDQKIQDVEDRLNAKLQRALDNPLAN